MSMLLLPTTCNVVLLAELHYSRSMTPSSVQYRVTTEAASRVDIDVVFSFGSLP